MKQGYNLQTDTVKVLKLILKDNLFTKMKHLQVSIYKLLIFVLQHPIFVSSHQNLYDSWVVIPCSFFLWATSNNYSKKDHFTSLLRIAPSHPYTIQRSHLSVIVIKVAICRRKNAHTYTYTCNIGPG